VVVLIIAVAALSSSDDAEDAPTDADAAEVRLLAAGTGMVERKKPPKASAAPTAKRASHRSKSRATTADRPHRSDVTMTPNTANETSAKRDPDDAADSPDVSHASSSRRSRRHASRRHHSRHRRTRDADATESQSESRRRKKHRNEDAHYKALFGSEPGETPIRLSRDAVQAGMRRVAKRVKKCAKKETRPIVISVTIGKNGRVTNAAASGSFAGTDIGECAARVVRTAKFPLAKQAITLKYPFHP
jgi:hypothetical protein